MSSKPINLAVLVSGGGTTLQNLMDEIAAGTLAARISIVIASRPGIFALQRAAKGGITSVVVERKNFGDVRSFSDAVFSHCRAAGAELICMAGWLSLVSPPAEFAGRVMNIHPALLPKFGGRGMYGAHVHEAVIREGCATSGCTVHFVDEQYDHGPIILQRSCAVMAGDTPRMLAERVAEEEKIAYPEAIRLFQQRRLVVEAGRVRVVGAGGQ